MSRFQPLSQEKIYIMERFGDSDVQDLAHEVLTLRRIIRSLYGESIDLSMFFKED